jgi:phycobilisome core linker protein
MFVQTSFLGSRVESSAKCVLGKESSSSAGQRLRMIAYDMDGSGSGNLTPRRIKSSGVANDRRMFKVSYVLPSESRVYSGRELQNVATTKMVPFTSWYREQQRIMKMGGRITKVELASGTAQRNVGNT